MANNELVYRAVRDALDSDNMGDIIEDVYAAVASYVQACEEDEDKFPDDEIAAEARHALPAVHDLVGELIAAQAGR